MELYVTNRSYSELPGRSVAVAADHYSDLECTITAWWQAIQLE